jgi:hypothetical protein
MCSNMTRTFVELNQVSKNDPLIVLKSIYAGVNVYQNFTGDTSCFDISLSTPSDINMVSWDYQVNIVYFFTARLVLLNFYFIDL